MYLSDVFIAYRDVLSNCVLSKDDLKPYIAENTITQDIITEES